MEGSPMQMDCMDFHSLEALSCRNIFEKFPSKKKLHNLAVYVLFYLKHSVCLNVPSQFPLYTFGNDRFNSSGEISHLLLISHKFPATENFQDDPNISCNSSLYAEAIVLPYKLILQKDNDDKLLADVLFGKEHKESYIESFRNTEVCHKRRKSFEIPCRANFLCLKDDFEEDERNRLKIRCLFTFSSINDQKDPIPGYLCYTKNIAAGNITDKRRDQRVLLEFKSDSFFIYQSLQIGWYYCLKCSSSGQCHTVNSEINHVKILIESQSILWSVAFKFGEIVHHQDPSKDCFFGASSSRISEAYVGDTSLNKIFFQQSLGQIDGNSDVHIYLSPVQIEKGAFIRTLPELGEILSVASCVQIMRAKVARNLNAGDCQISDMPQGNLISLYGNIEHIQIENYSPISYVSSKNFECLDIDKRASGIVIHVNDDHQKVQIHGNMRKHAYPLGMGPGANATFHRVLITCNSTGFPRLVLTPVSFIVINFIKEIGRRHTKEFTSHLELNVPNQESSEIVPLGLISQLSQCIGSKLIRLTCRVVTVHTLVLELPKHVSLKSQTSNQLKLPAYNITLAGLLLDDGSCLSCCWANEVRAERLLRLHETRQRPFFYNRGSSKKAGIRGYQDTVGFHLEKMLKKHHRVTIKNNRVLPDISTLGFTFAVDSEEVFSYSEERLLRHIMVNACVGSAFNIIGNVMDSNAIQLLGAEYEELNVAVPTMTNLWITEVGYLNSLKEARTIFHELSN